MAATELGIVFEAPKSFPLSHLLLLLGLSAEGRASKDSQDHSEQAQMKRYSWMSDCPPFTLSMMSNSDAEYVLIEVSLWLAY